MVLLRDYQKRFVARSIAALQTHGNSLAIAPTGGGKTWLISSVIGQLYTQGYRTSCILAHREELTAQNAEKFRMINPDLSISFMDATVKSWQGDATFAMVQTLSRTSTLHTMPKLDLLVIDEAHHVVAKGYRKIIDYAKQCNPDCLIYGVTATPMRGDKKGLREVFSNIADRITVSELIRLGYLVTPRNFVIDVGVKEHLRHVKRAVSDYDMVEVEKIMNKRPVTEAVIHHWQEKAAGRKTIIFCSTVDHAHDVHRAFLAAGIAAECLHGGLSKTERSNVLERYEHGTSEVIVNVAILTEGYDYTPTSCIILLRPSSFRSTMIQMIGRGLRVVDPQLFPHIVKHDCIILDFGTATLTHGSLEQEAMLTPPQNTCKQEATDLIMKACPECQATLPAAESHCPLCHYVWEEEEEATEEIQEEITSSLAGYLSNFHMAEVDLLSQSPFLWCDIFQTEDAFIATGFHAWGGVFYDTHHWYAIGGAHGLATRLLMVGKRTQCLSAANDWLNSHESEGAAHKTKRWLYQPATEKQRKHLPPRMQMDFGLTRYHASNLLTFQFNKKDIQSLIITQQEKRT